MEIKGNKQEKERMRLDKRVSERERERERRGHGQSKFGSRDTTLYMYILWYACVYNKHKRSFVIFNKLTLTTCTCTCKMI